MHTIKERTVLKLLENTCLSKNAIVIMIFVLGVPSKNDERIPISFYLTIGNESVYFKTGKKGPP